MELAASLLEAGAASALEPATAALELAEVAVLEAGAASALEPATAALELAEVAALEAGAASALEPATAALDVAAASALEPGITASLEPGYASALDSGFMILLEPEIASALEFGSRKSTELEDSVEMIGMLVILSDEDSSLHAASIAADVNKKAPRTLCLLFICFYSFFTQNT